MSPFEFLISFYGILLGLSIAELASGFSRVWDKRAVHGIGWLAPLLGTIMLADLVSFWTNTWLLKDVIEVGYFTALGAAAITLLYYFAATQVFPREGADAVPDAHAMAHRKVVVSAMIASNVLLMVALKIILDLSTPRLLAVFLTYVPLLAALICVGWLRTRRSVRVAMLVCLPLTIIYKPFADGVWSALIERAG
ncbi:hypothetical protein GGR88_001758 [Sphingomonas jejuensis]|uniref:Uncharacterized protein n=1 Tax=Sphingomonas jejuensis TaxID=904715 RepID=A0ABX0XNC3_9SPHN|nr:hypothetical protein [Sphingomonas jejuensis]NJC34284.1 hypothetical protein [Sphingomonas jejuensis]